MTRERKRFTKGKEDRKVDSKSRGGKKRANRPRHDRVRAKT